MSRTHGHGKRTHGYHGRLKDGLSPRGRRVVRKLTNRRRRVEDRREVQQQTGY